MTYHVRYDKRADKQLEKMDGGTRRLVLAYINSKLNGTEDPRALGKGLTGDRAGQWRYRIGDYRLLAVIKDDELIIYIFKIAHRSTVYKQD